MVLSILYCNDILINLFDYMNYDDSTNLSKCSKNIRLKYIKYFRLIDNQHIIGKLTKTKIDVVHGRKGPIYPEYFLKSLAYDNYLCRIKCPRIINSSNYDAKCTITCGKRDDTECNTIEIGFDGYIRNSSSGIIIKSIIIDQYIIIIKERKYMVGIDFYSLPKLVKKVSFDTGTNIYNTLNKRTIVDKISNDLKYILLFVHYTNTIQLARNKYGNRTLKRTLIGYVIMLKCDELCYNVMSKVKNVIYNERHENEQMINMVAIIDKHNEQLKKNSHAK